MLTTPPETLSTAVAHKSYRYCTVLYNTVLYCTLLCTYRVRWYVLPLFPARFLRPHTLLPLLERRPSPSLPFLPFSLPLFPPPSPPRSPSPWALPPVPRVHPTTTPTPTPVLIFGSPLEGSLPPSLGPRACPCRSAGPPAAKGGGAEVLHERRHSPHLLLRGGRHLQELGSVYLQLHTPGTHTVNPMSVVRLWCHSKLGYCPAMVYRLWFDLSLLPLRAPMGFCENALGPRRVNPTLLFLAVR